MDDRAVSEYAVLEKNYVIFGSGSAYMYVAIISSNHDPITIVCKHLFHGQLSAPMFHHSVWGVITAHKLTAAKRDVTTVVSDQ